MLSPTQLSKISASTPPPDIATKVIAIDGGGGAGKTTLASGLSAQLGGMPIVHIDDFISGAQAPDVWWQRLCDDVLKPLGQNQTAHYQRFDWDANQLAEWHDIAPGGTVILEGVSSLRPEFRPYLSYGIWIETPEAVRIDRALARGQHGIEQWREWAKWDANHLARNKPDKYADLVVYGGN
ncbi:MAG: hypothetical protein JWN01_196 [Patescibacteria group bacterium]|nr:hypothetical protein [Patescibacteria group bacterium]